MKLAAGRTKAIRLSLILIIPLMVTSSSIFVFINPAVASITTSSSSSPLPTASTIPSAPSTIGQNGREGEFTTQALSSLTARPTNNIVNTNSFYDIVFLTGTSGAIKRIQVTFPAGTIIPSGAFFNEAEGIGPGTVSESGQTLTYTVTNAVNVPVGTKIRLEFSNLNNPLNPSANYKVTVTTRNSANVIIDGPTQSTAYIVKQIGSSAIADNSITSNDISQSFIRSKQLVDGQNGWDPDGIITSFEISDPMLTDNSHVFVNIFEGSTSQAICGVENVFDGNFFKLECLDPPQVGSSMQYTVVDQPNT